MQFGRGPKELLRQIQLLRDEREARPPIHPFRQTRKQCAVGLDVLRVGTRADPIGQVADHFVKPARVADGSDITPPESQAFLIETVEIQTRRGDGFARDIAPDEPIARPCGSGSLEKQGTTPTERIQHP